jgi:D-beta-D-heptose 7-phosphate kinase / D-beta-D-heptose 1-phosphate adenosyltransferase
VPSREQRRLVVVGDVLLDRDIAGTVDRLSPEAPVPLVGDARSVERPGGAGPVALLAARSPGWRVTLVTGVGRDAAGTRVRGLLERAGVEVVDLATGGATPVKTRVRAADRTLLRYDTAGAPLLGPLRETARSRLAEAAAAVVSYYSAQLTVHTGLRSLLTELAGQRPVVWDRTATGPLRCRAPRWRSRTPTRPRRCAAPPSRGAWPVTRPVPPGCASGGRSGRSR